MREPLEASEVPKLRREIPMAESMRSVGNGANQPLPKPNMVVAKSGTSPHEMTQEAITGMVINPISTGIAPFPRMVEDEAWVRACEKVI